MELCLYPKINSNMDHGIKYSIKTSKRAKRLRIVVNCDAQVSVVVPTGFDVRLIDQFIAKKVKWIQAKVNFFSSREKMERPKAVVQDSYHSCSARAKRLVKERLEYFNNFYNFQN